MNIRKPEKMIKPPPLTMRILNRRGEEVFDKLTAKQAYEVARENRKEFDDRLLKQCYQCIKSAAYNGSLEVSLDVGKETKSDSIDHVKAILEKEGFTTKANVMMSQRGVEFTRITIYWRHVS